MLIFERGTDNRSNGSQLLEPVNAELPEQHRRTCAPALPAVSELEVVRHYTNLSRKNFSIDTHFYPLGSCTMKYNPRGAHRASMTDGFLNRHPLAPTAMSQGTFACLHDLQEWICTVTGMKAASLAPMAGAQGEFAGVAMIRQYHMARGDDQRSEILIPSAAHGTNPATAVMCGYKVREVPVLDNGDVDVEALRQMAGPQTAGLMMTNPSTCGVFERQIEEVAKIVHGAGGLLYYDGANLNAILGYVRPGDMGFDVLHMNLHKTFATPHGGGGPGAGPVAVNEKLARFLPGPVVVKSADDQYRLAADDEMPDTIGRLSTFYGNAGVLRRAYYYAATVGREGLRRVAGFSTLNANYLHALLQSAGFDLAYPGRRATHELIVTFSRLLKETGVNAMDVAKRLLDYGFHAPTTYFPLLIPECHLIEPTETESPELIAQYVEVLSKIVEEAQNDPEVVKNAPHTLPVRRLDDVKAARELNLRWRKE